MEEFNAQAGRFAASAQEGGARNGLGEPLTPEQLRARTGTPIGHRFGRHVAPENTVEAMLVARYHMVQAHLEGFRNKGEGDEAFDRRIPAILQQHPIQTRFELDVRLTKDGEVVAFHDKDLARTTNGLQRVAETDTETFLAKDTGSWFHQDVSPLDPATKDGLKPSNEWAGVSQSDYRGIKPASFDEVAGIVAMMGDKIGLAVELKVDGESPERATALAQKTTAIMRKHGLVSGKDTVCSFDRHTLRACKDAAPDIPRQLISVFPPADWKTAGKDLALEGFHMNGGTVAATMTTVLDMQDAGYATRVWTSNDANAMRDAFMDKGIDVITDKPAVGVVMARDAREQGRGGASDINAGLARMQAVLNARSHSK